MDRYIWFNGGTVQGAARYFSDAAAMGFNTIAVPLPWAVIEPTQGSYDWTWLEAYIDDAYSSGLRVELLWYGSDVGGAAYADLVPSWVLDDPATYQPHINSDGSVSFSATGDGIDGSETALSYADPDLLAQEKGALTAICDKLAATDIHHTVIGLQVNNETQVNIPGIQNDRSYDPQATAAFNMWAQQTGDHSGLDFAEYQIAEYQNALGETIKQSAYPMFTMMNYWMWQPTASSSLIRSDAPSIDFTGNDVYSDAPATIEANIQPQEGLLSVGENTPYYNGSTLMLDALASGAVQYNTYYLVWSNDDQPMSGALEDVNGNWQPNAIPISSTLRQLAKDNQDLATHVTGSDIAYFHLVDSNPNDNETSNLGGVVPLSYSTSSSAQGIAILNQDDVSLMSTGGTSSFTLTTSSLPDSVTDGYYDDSHLWVPVSSASYVNNENGTITVTVTGSQFINLHFSQTLSSPSSPGPSGGSSTSPIVVTPSVTSGGPASGLLAEGDSSGGYVSAQSPAFPQYLTLSYSSPVSVDGLGISSNYGQGQGVTRFNVQVTANGSDWTTVASEAYAYQTSDETVETPFVSFAKQSDVVGIRVQVEDANLEWGHFVTDGIYVASVPMGVGNLVTPSVSSGSPASGLLAGGDSTVGYVSAQSPSFPQYLTLSYGSPVSVDGLGMSSNYGEGQGVTQFNVQVTTDGSNWTTVASDSYVYQTNDETVETPFVTFAKQSDVVGVRVQVEAANLEWYHFVTDGLYVTGMP